MSFRGAQVTARGGVAPSFQAAFPGAMSRPTLQTDQTPSLQIGELPVRPPPVFEPPVLGPVPPYGGGSAGAGLPGMPIGAFQPEAGDGPTLARNLRGRYAGTEKFNLWSILGSTTGSADWMAIQVDKPTLLLPTEQLFGSLHFAYGAIPQGAGVSDPRYLAMKALGPGVIYLWAPGTWWVKYSGNGLYAKLLQVAAEDPAIVAQALSLPGCQKISTSLVTVSDAAGVQLAAANPFRRSLFLTGINDGTYTPVISNNVPCGVSIGYTPAATLLTTSSYVLNGIAASIELAGNSLFSGTVTAICGVTGDIKLIVQERE